MLLLSFAPPPLLHPFFLRVFFCSSNFSLFVFFYCNFFSSLGEGFFFSLPCTFSSVQAMDGLICISISAGRVGSVYGGGGRVAVTGSALVIYRVGTRRLAICRCSKLAIRDTSGFLFFSFPFFFNYDLTEKSKAWEMGLVCTILTLFFSRVSAGVPCYRFRREM